MEISQFFINGDIKGAIAYMRGHRQPDRLGGAGRPAGAGLPAVHTGDGQG